MAYYRQLGPVPQQRHTLFKDEDGNVLYEELMGEEGFSLDSALLYHQHIPSALVGARTWELPDQSLTPNDPLLPRHLRLHDLFTEEQTPDVDAVTGRRLVLGNSDVRLSYAHVGTTSPLYKNGLGDECVYVEAGSALVETQFGPLEVAEGDYVMIPRATIHRWVLRGDETARLYFIEANSHIAPPKRYLSKYGQLLEHAPYSERDLRGPTETLLREESDVELYIKHRGRGTSGLQGSIHILPHHPFDVVGWDGCLYPYVFNIKNYMPLTGKVHQPPPSHQVFEGHNFVICNFVPRKVDYHELAVPVPYYHSNVDSDEIMFYVDGDYEARKGSGIAKGSISIHPGGHPHGPQPGAIEASIGAEYFDETAVMVDTFRPLDLGEAALATDDGLYASSWTGGRWIEEAGR
ncbi:homogentisate 1,2-dioxygenase domain-containing protein [Arthrobacter sp. StoSoilB22]|uniref:homogentisate 1,2-dioxygenase n=1 Tax=Arthrobacter sp. StoSoilB22 TaxID=2830996 RepID=UPI001CC46764|nr:homogentisate 1,2-dioxygenase domain-containing protein [Arthrobacter sp. StoSoilB22]BCW62861.1 putative homogentisate 1,2-dioxygenase [Arthrobacter sp. StoSoilB22]